MSNQLDINTVQSLMVAKTLLSQLRPLCTSSDRYLATAGLIALQDALELVVFGVLIVLGVDEERSLKKVSFDELLGELKKRDVKVPHLTKLKSLNQARVLAKHNGEVAEPVTVRAFYDAALAAIDSVTQQVLGKSLSEFFLADVLDKGEVRDFMVEANIAIEEKRYMDALVAVRKAFFLVFEEGYSIYGWRNVSALASPGLFEMFAKGGRFAPHYTRNREWIEHHVKVPTDYVQIDREVWRLNALESGISTADLDNIRVLTPDVFRGAREDSWSVVHRYRYEYLDASEENARLCFDLVMSCVLKIQQHRERHVYRSSHSPYQEASEIGLGVLRSLPQDDATVVHEISANFLYQVERVVQQLNPSATYYEVFGTPRTVFDGPQKSFESLRSIHGFLNANATL